MAHNFKQEVLLKEAVGTPLLITLNNNTKTLLVGQVHVYSNLPSLQ